MSRGFCILILGLFAAGCGCGNSLPGAWKIIGSGVKKGDFGRVIFEGDGTIKVWIDVPMGSDSMVRVAGNGTYKIEGDILNVTLDKTEVEYFGNDEGMRKSLSNLDDYGRNYWNERTSVLLSGTMFWEGKDKFGISALAAGYMSPQLQRE